MHAMYKSPCKTKNRSMVNVVSLFINDCFMMLLVEAAAAVPVPGHGRLMAGTVLIREHEGRQHHVMVTDGNFVWNGKTFPSLSKVAHAITGTKWNGPRFFGLRDKASPS